MDKCTPDQENFRSRIRGTIANSELAENQKHREEQEDQEDQENEN